MANFTDTWLNTKQLGSWNYCSCTQQIKHRPGQLTTPYSTLNKETRTLRCLNGHYHLTKGKGRSREWERRREEKQRTHSPSSTTPVKQLSVVHDIQSAIVCRLMMFNRFEWYHPRESTVQLLSGSVLFSLAHQNRLERVTIKSDVHVFTFNWRRNCR